MFKKQVEKFDIDIDDGRVKIKDLDANFMMVFNGKLGGDKVYCNPLGFLNDGYVEMIYYNGLPSTDFSLKLFDGAKNGGVQFYDNNLVMERFKTLKLTNKSMEPLPKKNKKDPIEYSDKKAVVDICVDGEDLDYSNFAKFEVLKQEIDIIVDFWHIF